ncbi:NUDIX domain-containing protein [Lampropedia puyangensis]|uniref:NUDIX domain-containing protein n=1 Tax=Lampropedia puyangensis TaxID=1330072 RepID=A0A4V4GQY0_9BURK|nr:NUDIX domain-containing protein [Lampropedia puyangensis]THT99915.1 NUDIX domain-containing protein [Lampropedia puyangensis]
MTYEVRFCSHCGTALEWMPSQEDSGLVNRLRCPACGWTHWNNPTPVLAAIVQYQDKIVLARNALWKDPFFGLITGFMEAGESPEAGIAREVKEEINLDVQSCQLIDVSEFLRMNQVLIAYHVVATGIIKLSPELSEYKLVDPSQATVWTSGTGRALQKWLRTQGFEPEVIERYPNGRPTEDNNSSSSGLNKS